jgi:hypothetical protein
VNLQRQDYDTVQGSEWSDYHLIQEDIYIDSSNSAEIVETLPSGVYRYRLQLTSDPAVASEHAEVKVPYPLRLGQSYPNPFIRGHHSEISIPYTVGGNPNGPHEGERIGELREVTLIVYDVTGARVRVLWDGLLDPGVYITPWNGLNDQSELVASGTYYYRLSAEGQTATGKLVFLR